MSRLNLFPQVIHDLKKDFYLAAMKKTWVGRSGVRILVPAKFSLPKSPIKITSISSLCTWRLWMCEMHFLIVPVFLGRAESWNPINKRSTKTVAKKLTLLFTCLRKLACKSLGQQCSSDSAESSNQLANDVPAKTTDIWNSHCSMILLLEAANAIAATEMVTAKKISAQLSQFQILGRISFDFFLQWLFLTGSFHFPELGAACLKRKTLKESFQQA